jgi:hypothetical protein
MMRFSIGRACSPILFSVVGVATALGGAACGEDDKPQASNGVNDVRKACDLRATWNRTGTQCSVCESAAVSPRCECSELAAFSATCIEQADARKPLCNASIEECVNTCLRDCDCIEKCYANDAACKSASAARDGCVTEACGPHCK